VSSSESSYDVAKQRRLLKDSGNRFGFGEDEDSYSSLG
jgi:hypothetical protein